MSIGKRDFFQILIYATCWRLHQYVKILSSGKGDNMHVDVKEVGSKMEMYNHLCAEGKKVLLETDDKISKLANASALLNLFLKDINWVGFYLADGEQLVLGPFQGKPAVTRINFGEGVCGTAAKEREVQIIDNVHNCCNHIACDINSKSEIVVPVVKDGRLIGVLDIDSPIYIRFDEEDSIGLSNFTNLLIGVL